MNETKAIVIDLDGVLWEGSCHAGLHSIRLKTEMIEALSSLAKKGIVIASLSANHSHVAEGTLSALGIMHLFSDWRFDFNSKETGMRSLLDDLHLLPDNVIYIDDTPYERGLIRMFFPKLLVFDVDESLKFLAQLNKDLPEPKSTESFERTKLYRQERQRRRQEQYFVEAPENFLIELGTTITLTWNVKRHENLIRIEEMFSRNHQFNSASVYYTLQQLQQMASSDHFSVAMVEVRDKYGSYGICGCILFSNKKNGGTLLITDLTFSCRVQRPHIIDSVLRYVISSKKKQGYDRVSIRFSPTEHNFHLAEVFHRLGLKRKLVNTNVTYEEAIDNDVLSIPNYITIIESVESVIRTDGRIPFIYNYVEEFFRSQPITGKVLDIGSGSLDSLGKTWYEEMSIQNQGISIVKVDIDPRWQPDVIADATDLGQFQTNSIDVVMCLETLEHMQSFWKAIDEFLRVLKIGGYLLLSAPLNLEIHGGSNDFFRFTPKGLVNLLQNAGKNNETIDTQFLIEKSFIEGDPIFPRRTFIIATKIEKGSKP